MASHCRPVRRSTLVTEIGPSQSCDRCDSRQEELVPRGLLATATLGKRGVPAGSYLPCREPRAPRDRWYEPLARRHALAFTRSGLRSRQNWTSTVWTDWADKWIIGDLKP